MTVSCHGFATVSKLSRRLRQRPESNLARRRVDTGNLAAMERNELPRGAFGRIRPRTPVLNGKGGLGAWELAARYSYLSLDDEDVDGGELHDVTGALNGYPTVNLRFALNYVFSQLEGVGDAHIAMARFQVVF